MANQEHNMKAELLETKLVKFSLKGKEFEAHVNIKMDVDECVSVDDIEDPNDIEAFERGDLTAYVLIIEASWKGVEGLDVLGGCWITGPNQWQNFVVDHDMIENAIADMLEQINDMLKAIDIAIE